MNYDLPKIKQSEIEYNIDVAMSHGDMPKDLLVAKFEETDMGADEDVYENYARGILVDMRPDTLMTAADEPRGRVNSSAGRLQLQYYGHRGNAEPASHPEMFLGFMGNDNVDPRGHAIDPDFKQLKAQYDARMRFVNWTPDGSDDITGGGRSPEKALADQQTIFKWTKDHLKIFTSQKDGRVEGLRKAWRHCSAKANQVQSGTSNRVNHVQSDLFTPQRKATIIAETIRNRREYRDQTNDQDYEVQKYSQTGRRTKKHNTANSMTMITQDGDLASSDNSKCFKTVALLMNQIVRCRTTMQKTIAQDTDYGKHVESQTRKHENVSRDLALILQSIAHENSWGSSDNTMTVKTKAPVMAAHLANVISLNHLLPAQHYLTAELMYKSVKPGADVRKVKDYMVYDGETATMEDVKNIFMKSSYRESVSGGKSKGRSNIDLHDWGMETHNYKLARAVNGDRRIRITSGEDFKSESDNSKFGHNNHQNYRNPDANDTVQGGQFSENLKAERHGGRLGNKSAIRRKIDRDMVSNEIAALN